MLLADVRVMVLTGLTVMVPVAVTLPHPPVRVTVYPNGLPVVVDGEPLIVMLPAEYVPFTPAGSPLNVAPAAPVEVYVILFIAEFRQAVWMLLAEVRVMVLTGVTVMVPVAVTVPHPPVRVTVYPNGLPVVVDGEPLIVIFPAEYVPLTPEGSPLNVAPVAPVDEYVILAIGEFKQTVWVLLPDVRVIVLTVLTVIVPVAVTVPHPPVRVTVYPNGLPVVVDGEPLMVIFPAEYVPLTPAGSPLNVAPLAPVDVYVISVIGELRQTVWVLLADVRVMVLAGVTVIVPVAVTLPHPPVRVTVYPNGLPVVVDGEPLIVMFPAE